jgi:predicted NBD/HSP70 family sugar kinase
MDAEKVRLLGVDVGGTSVKLAMLEGVNVSWTGQSPFYVRPDTETLVDAIRRAAAGRATAVDAIGLCVPGLQDEARSKVTLSVNVPGLVGVPFVELLRRALGPQPASVKVVNDGVATAADIYQARKMNGRLVVLALGTGVGMAVLDDGVPLRVEGDSPGHIGQIDVSLPGHDVVGPDGGAGGLEGYVGAAALKRRLGDDLVAGWRTMGAEDPALLALARAIRICHAIYRPHHVVLAGGIGIRLGHLIPDLRLLISDRLTSLARPGWTLTAADHDFHAAIGAARASAPQALEERGLG